MKKNGLILVAEDDADLRELVISNLQRVGLKTLEARDGLEGLRLVREHRPHAILTDNHMPNKSGLQMIAELRSEGVEMPTIIFTGYSSIESTIQAVRLGVIDFIEKPFSMSYLVESAERAVSLGIEMQELEIDLELSALADPVSPESQLARKRKKWASMILRRNLETPKRRAG